MRLSRFVLAALVLVSPGLLGCAEEVTEEVTKEPIVDIQTPLGDVKVDSDGVDVQAGGVGVTTDSATGEVAVEVDSAEKPAE